MATPTIKGFPGGSDSKVFVCNAGDLGLIPGQGRSPREGNGNSLQYSCLENSMDAGTWQATDHRIAKSRTQLSNFTGLLAKDYEKLEPLWKEHFASSVSFTKKKKEKVLSGY